MGVMKLAVLFPGIGYHCDKPLLYYAAKLAKAAKYEVLPVSYTGLSDIWVLNGLIFPDRYDISRMKQQ